MRPGLCQGYPQRPYAHAIADALWAWAQRGEPPRLPVVDMAGIVELTGQQDLEPFTEVRTVLRHSATLGPSM
jgi:hypothetical protein